MPATATTIERITGKVSDQPLLFQYTIKLVLLVAFLELILYRLVSRLGMHLSKLAADHQWIIPTFTALTEVGQWLLNVVAILLFLGLTVGLANRLAARGFTGLTRFIAPCIALLLLLSEYLSTHHERSHRLLRITYLLGIGGWLYYQIVSTFFSFAGTVVAPPMVYESHRAGEAFMVLASMLVFWAYGRGVSFRSRNQRQRHRAIWFWSTAAAIFVSMFFLDYLLSHYNPGVANNVRKAADGIGWIFQFGMGYTFYLPFALYMAGLLCWSYTVIKLLTMGRLAGYALGLMFIAGYALLYSNLTLMVVLGVMLLTMDRSRRDASDSVADQAVMRTSDSLVGGHV